MFGTVQEMKRSKSGKSTNCKINGKWLVASSRINLDGVAVGGSVEYEEGSFPGDNGPIACINKIRPAAPPAGAPAAPQSAAVDEASLRFISNVVGSAITSGAIKDPNGVGPWSIAALRALKSLETAQQLKDVLDQPGDPEFDDSAKLNEDMPENFYNDLPPSSRGGAPKSW